MLCIMGSIAGYVKRAIRKVGWFWGIGAVGLVRLAIVVWGIFRWVIYLKTDIWKYLI